MCGTNQRVDGLFELQGRPLAAWCCDPQEDRADEKGDKNECPRVCQQGGRVLVELDEDFNGDHDGQQDAQERQSHVPGFLAVCPEKQADSGERDHPHGNQGERGELSGIQHLVLPFVNLHSYSNSNPIGCQN